MAALQQHVYELIQQKEALMLAAIDEIKALEDVVEAYRLAVGTVEQAQALATNRRGSHPPEGVVPLKLELTRGSGASNSPASATSQDSDGTVDVSSSDDDD